MKTKKCSDCGAAIPADAADDTACSYCGGAFVATDDEPAEATKGSPGPVEREEEQGMPVLAIGVSILIFFAGAMGFVYLMLKFGE